jgi:phosphoglycolate phosphatase
MFDFDGTITDSIPSAIDAVQKMIKTLNFPYKTKDEIHEFVGFGEIPLISGSIGTNEPKALKQAMDTYEEIYKKEGIFNIRLYPHVREALEYFKNKSKVIVSNKKDEFINIILKNLELDRFFEHVYGGDTSPCLKPDPCAILHILEKYNVPPEKALFVGDMTVDVKTGKNAKTHTCAVTYGFDSGEKLKKEHPDMLIDDLLELKTLIG